MHEQNVSCANLGSWLTEVPLLLPWASQKRHPSPPGVSSPGLGVRGGCVSAWDSGICPSRLLRFLF